MARSCAHILEDILEAIAGIESAVAGKDYEDFQDDWLTRHGVERGIEIISEASRHIPGSLLAFRPEIPWNEIRGVGNVLRHEYHRVSCIIIWNIIDKHLPPLKTAVREMLNGLDE